MKLKNKVSVVILVNDEGKILVLRRAPGTRSFSGYWNFPGGGVDEGETLEGAAVRELKEEAGLTISPDDLTYFQVSVLPKIIVHFFMANKYDGEVNINWESTDYKWVSIDEIKELKFIPMSPRMLNDIEYYMRLLNG